MGGIQLAPGFDISTHQMQYQVRCTHIKMLYVYLSVEVKGKKYPVQELSMSGHRLLHFSCKSHASLAREAINTLNDKLNMNLGCELLQASITRYINAVRNKQIPDICIICRSESPAFERFF